MKLHFVSDPGHAWLQVPKDLVKAVGLTRADFSDFSVRRGPIFYLEEDCDAGVFMDAWKSKNPDNPVQFVEVESQGCANWIRENRG